MWCSCWTCVCTVVGQEFLIPSSRRQWCKKAIWGYGAVTTVLALLLAARVTRDRVIITLLRYVRCYHGIDYVGAGSEALRLTMQARILPQLPGLLGGWPSSCSSSHHSSASWPRGLVRGLDSRYVDRSPRAMTASSRTSRVSRTHYTMHNYRSHGIAMHVKSHVKST